LEMNSLQSCLALTKTNSKDTSVFVQERPSPSPPSGDPVEFQVAADGCPRPKSGSCPSLTPPVPKGPPKNRRRPRSRPPRSKAWSVRAGWIELTHLICLCALPAPCRGTPSQSPQAPYRQMWKFISTQRMTRLTLCSSKLTLRLT